MRRALLSAILLLTPPLTGVATACPNCKDSVRTTAAEAAVEGTGNLPGGFNTSIYVMLGGVFVVSGLVVRMVVKESRG